MNGGKRAGLQGDHRLARSSSADIDRRRSHVHELGVFLVGFALILDGCEKLSERRTSDRAVPGSMTTAVVWVTLLE